MAGKTVIPAKQMAEKVQAAVAARRDQNTFIIARTDAIAAENMTEALRRGELYLKAGADGLFIEGPTSITELEEIAKTFKGVPKIANMFEGGGKTPVLTPSELHQMGFEMIVYPTSILFRVAKTIQHAAKALMQGRPMTPAEGVDMEEFEKIVGIEDWKAIEDRFQKQDNPVSRLLHKVTG